MLEKITKQPDIYDKMAKEAAVHYQRLRHLPALLALWPSQIDDFSLEGTKLIIEQLKVALLAERRRGRVRHWAYDLNRHMALLGALRGEQQHLLTMAGKSGEKRGYTRQHKD